MEECELFEYSLNKNLQEFVEFVVYNLHINNYYDLVDYIVNLHNFRAKIYKSNKELAEKIIYELKEEDRQNG